MTDARVLLWGSDIGAITWLDNVSIGVFQYAPEFLHSGIEVSPFTMPLRAEPFRFPELAFESFKRLPGLLADSLPDQFGNALIDAWLVRAGRTADSFNPVERLCYIGSRGMGALEFLPTIVGAPSHNRKVDVAALVALANEVLNQRTDLSGKLSGTDDADAIQDILRVGTSAGGARAKAILSWNRDTGEFRSGQLPNEPGFSHWMIKFDGIVTNRDKELADPQGYGQIEYAYHLMAIDAGIEMSECRLLREGGRAHFMTRRFDRTESNQKLHLQTLGALRHFDFNQAGAHSYEQAIETILRLKLPMLSVEQLFRRAVFNVIGRNQDDHVKNIAFLMDRRGHWQLAPAYDLVYSFNPAGVWTVQHQMSLNGKRDHFELEDLVALARYGGIKKRAAIEMIAEVDAAFDRWPAQATSAEIDETDIRRIAGNFRRGWA